jgi:hypothetical protein
VVAHSGRFAKCVISLTNITQFVVPNPRSSKHPTTDLDFVPVIPGRSLGSHFVRFLLFERLVEDEHLLKKKFDPGRGCRTFADVCRQLWGAKLFGWQRQIAGRLRPDAAYEPQYFEPDIPGYDTSR